MQDLIPKNLIQPAPPDLSFAFASDETSATRSRVVKYLRDLYFGQSDKSFELRSRPNIITEEFFLLMPSLDAWIAELDLAAAIIAHSRNEIDDVQMRLVLAAYVDSHTFCYWNGGREAKTGDCGIWTREISLYYVVGNEFSGVVNPVQAWLVSLIFENEKLRMVRL